LTKRPALAAPKPWIWSFLAALVTWVVAITASAGLGAGAMLTASLSFAVFSVLAGIGQMFVIASGAGNIDLSIPAVITIGGIAAMKLMGGENTAVLPGLIGTGLLGSLIGAGNAGLIRLLKVPPIIATLAMSFIVQSVAIAYRNDLQIEPPAALAWATTARTLGVPLLAVLGIVLTAALGVVLHRTVYGQSVLAIGQNSRAAWLAGFRISRTRVVTYALSGMLAALCGALLAAFSGGASLDMGNEYLMASIAIVVIGGTSASGGRANLLGIWGAALFLYLLRSMLNSLGVGMGWRLVLNGFIVVAVIVAAGGEKWER
jgi:ribose transport system permease protein